MVNRKTTIVVYTPSTRKNPSLAPYHAPFHPYSFQLFFFFNDTPPPEIYPLSLHDALPISSRRRPAPRPRTPRRPRPPAPRARPATADRKSTRLNSSHTLISYAVFCLK